VAIYLHGTRKAVDIIGGSISTAGVLFCVEERIYRGRLWDLIADGGIREVIEAIRLSQRVKPGMDGNRSKGN
jgi:hypothetical protein